MKTKGRTLLDIVPKILREIQTEVLAGRWRSAWAFAVTGLAIVRIVLEGPTAWEPPPPSALPEPSWPASFGGDSGFCFELPLWYAAARNQSVWILSGNDGKLYLPLFTDRDAAQTFRRNSPHRPLRLRRINRTADALILLSRISPAISGVVWDRLPNREFSLTSSTQYVVQQLVAADSIP